MLTSNATVDDNHVDTMLGGSKMSSESWQSASSSSQPVDVGHRPKRVSPHPDDLNFSHPAAVRRSLYSSVKRASYHACTRSPTRSERTT